MKTLSRALLLSIAILIFASYMQAQAQVASAVVVSSCGTPPQTYTAGTIQPQTQDTNGKGCSSATTSPTGTQNVNVQQINGNTTSTAATGTQKVGVVGNAGATLDGTVAAGTAPTNGVAVIGQYTNNAGQPAATTAQTGVLQTDPAGNLRTAPQRPTAGDILDGYQTFTSTTSATTLITVTAGRTWVGTIGVNVACQEVAAGTATCQARGVITTSGTNVTPAAGTYLACEAKAGANAASGLVGDGSANYCAIPFTIVAPVGNTVLIQVATTNAGTASVVDASAVGVMQ